MDTRTYVLGVTRRVRLDALVEQRRRQQENARGRPWFRDTLPPAGLQQISFLRLDGDLYGSTKDAIERLEPLVSPGGLIYVDDYGSFRGCATAIDEYRAAKHLTEKLNPIVAGPSRKFQALWWRKAQRA